MKSGAKRLLSHQMTRDAKRPDDSGCKILQFRLRDDVEGRLQRPVDKVERDIGQLLDLSRYENLQRDTENYKLRTVENVAAFVLLSALVAIAAFDVVGLEQIQRCAFAGGC